MIREATDDEVRYVLSNLRDKDRDELMSLEWTDSLEDLIENTWNMPGVKWVILRGDEPIAIFGLSPISPGVGQAWVVGTEKIGLRGKELYKAAISARNELFSSGAIHRIQTCSAAAYEWSHKWIESLGFKRESTMRSYGKRGEDFHMYSMVKGDL